jgi:hypothetical protein
VAEWCIPAIPDTWEVETEYFEFMGSLDKVSETLSQRQNESKWLEYSSSGRALIEQAQGPLFNSQYSPQKSDYNYNHFSVNWLFLIQGKRMN